MAEDAEAIALSDEVRVGRESARATVRVTERERVSESGSARECVKMKMHVSRESERVSE